MRLVLLHGLAGHAGEWAATIAGLQDRHEVVAPDLPGHGGDDELPAIDGSTILVGQSYGGLLAMRLAADHPDLVRGLVVAEAAPSDGDTASVDEAGDSLRSWPEFTERAAALAYFESRGFDAETWVAGLDDGLRPRWRADDLERRLREAVERATWDVWEQIACPIVVVRGDRGTLPQAVADEMVARNPHARVVTLPGGHDVHLHAPDAWQRVVRAAADRAP
jgi:pimeloyl-ACP methyl ester carboxylesterase